METNEKCCMCGKPLDTIFVAQAWREQDLCSGRCWAELYGEQDCDYVEQDCDYIESED